MIISLFNESSWLDLTMVQSMTFVFIKHRFFQPFLSTRHVKQASWFIKIVWVTVKYAYLVSILNTYSCNGLLMNATLNFVYLAHWSFFRSTYASTHRIQAVDWKKRYFESLTVNETITKTFLIFNKMPSLWLYETGVHICWKWFSL